MTETHDPVRGELAGAEYRPLIGQLTRIAAMGHGATLVGDLAEYYQNTQRLSLGSELGSHVTTRLVEGPDALLSAEEIAQRLEIQGVVKEAPLFSDQIRDDARTEPFRYLTVHSATPRGSKSIREPKLEGRTTEIEGLRELHGLLTRFVQTKAERVRRNEDRKPSKTSELVAHASDMLDSLTFIGEPEYREAAEGLAAFWKSYLDADPRRKICLLTEMNALHRYRNTRKSDDYLKDKALQTFDPEELERYSGRIVENLEDLDAEPEHARIVMVDDWVISGKGIRDGYALLMQDPLFRKFAAAGSVEVNLLVASSDRIANGLPIVPTDASQGVLRVRAYYQAHYARHAHRAHRSYVTGLHSTANFSFGEICNGIARKSKGLHRTNPKLARIQSPYHHNQQSAVIVTRERLQRAPDEESPWQ